MCSDRWWQINNNRFVNGLMKAYEKTLRERERAALLREIATPVLEAAE
jgi:hypothetical protein